MQRSTVVRRTVSHAVSNTIQSAGRRWPAIASGEEGKGVARVLSSDQFCRRWLLQRAAR